MDEHASTSSEGNIYFELSMKVQHIKYFFHVSEDDDEEAKRKKTLQAERERAALLFEKKCKTKDIGTNQQVEEKKKKKKKKIQVLKVSKKVSNFMLYAFQLTNRSVNDFHCHPRVLEIFLLRFRKMQSI